MKKLIGKLETLLSEIREKSEEMQAIYDSRSENWQESEKGEEMTEKIDSLIELFDVIENTLDIIQN